MTSRHHSEKAALAERYIAGVVGVVGVVGIVGVVVGVVTAGGAGGAGGVVGWWLLLFISITHN